MAIGNDLGAGVGMTPEVFFDNLTNRNDAEKEGAGSTLRTIAFARTGAVIINRNTAEYEGFELKELPDYKKTLIEAENYLTPATAFSRAFAEKDQVEQLAQEYNALVDQYNDLLFNTKMRSDQLLSAVGKLNAFNESAAKDIKFFDKKLMKQFELDSRFENLVEEFKKMRLISGDAAIKAETPVDLLQALYRKHECEMQRHDRERNTHKVISKTILDKYEKLKMLNKKYEALIIETRMELDAAKQDLSQYQRQNFLDKRKLQEVTNIVKTKEQELSNKQALLVQKDEELKQNIKLVHNLTEDNKSLKVELQQEKVNLARMTKNAARKNDSLVGKIAALETQAKQFYDEKLQLEHKLSQLEDRHSKLTEAQTTNKNMVQSVAVSESEIKKLEAKLEVKDQELLGLKKDVFKLTDQMEKHKSQFSEEQLKQKETIQEYQNKLKVVRDELTEKKEELKKSDEETKRLLKSCSKLEQNLQGKQKTMSNLEMKLNSDAKEIAKLKAQEKALKSNLDSANRDIESYKKIVANKKAEADEIRVDYDVAVKKLENTLANQKEEIRKKDTAINALRKEVGHLKNKAESSGKESEKTDELISQKEDQITNLREDFQSACEQIAELKKDIEEKKSDIDVYKKKSIMASETLRSHGVDTSKKMSELKSSLNDLEGEVVEKGREIEELQSQYASAQDFIKTLQQKNGELVIELAKYDADRVEPKIEVTESSEESQRLLEQMQTEIANLKTQLENAYAQLQESINREQQNFNEYPSLSAEQKSLREENEELVDMYRKASEEKFQLEEKVVELEVANQDLLEKANTRNDEESDTEFELKQANRSIIQLNQQISKMERDHKEAIRELDEQLSKESKKATEANYQTLLNATAVDDVKALEGVNKQLQNSLTGLCDDLKGLISEEKYNHLMQKHFGQVELNAEVVEEHLIGFDKS